MRPANDFTSPGRSGYSPPPMIPRHRLSAIAALAFALVLAAPAAAQTRASTARDTSLSARYRETAGRLIGAALASDVAWRRLSELCDGIGHRLSGSRSLERAVEWAAATMRKDNLSAVRLQPVMVPAWVRGEESLQMILPAPQRLSMLGLGRSIGTPAGGITADVVVVRSFAHFDSLPDAAVRGRIVLYDVPFTNYGETVRHRATGAHRAARKGAVASLVRSVGPVSLRTPHTGAMAPYPDTIPHIPAAAVSMEDAMMMRRLHDRGERVVVRLDMQARTLPDARSHNVIGEIRGREKPNEVVVIGGHLDSWDVGQGAHDDGGGCVISMEALRLIRALGLTPRRTLRVVLWTNEENGIRGGRAYADSAGGGSGVHVAAIESDGGVEPPLAFDVTVRHAGTDSTDTLRTARAAATLAEIGRLLEGLGVTQFRPGGGGADIDPLMRKGVPGIGHRTTMAHYFDWHHTPSDMMDKVDPVELRKNVAAMAVMAYVLADMPGTLERGVAPASPPRAPGTR